MKKNIIIVLLSITLHMYGQYYFGDNPTISNRSINQMNALYSLKRYKDCIDSCNYYIGHRYSYFRLGYESHPYRDWRNKHGLWVSNNIEDIATVLYLGCISAYNYSLSTFDTRSIFDAIEWARACAAIYDDYLHENTPNEFWSAEKMYNYVIYGERGLTATQCGEHFLKVMGNDRWGKKQGKWFGKKSDSISDVLFKSVSGKEFIYSEYPILQYKISTISSNQLLKKGNYKELPNVFSKRIEAITKLIQQNDHNGIYNFEIHNGINTLTSTLCATVVENELCKKVGNNYERFCMENLIKLHDLSYNLNGSSRYSCFPNYTMQDIQNKLEEKDLAIIHFEAPVASGHYYYRYDLSTRFRLYALIITKNEIVPEVWHRGYINDSIVNDLNKIKESHPNANRFFYVGTPKMSAYMDVAGNDSSVIRLHSLSQLLREHKKETAYRSISFIGDLNYCTIGDTSSPSNKKGGEYRPLIGPAKELAKINSLFTNVRPICGDDATKVVVASEISRSKDIVHISTHGEANFELKDTVAPQLLIQDKSIMDNCRLILSGYNDNPNSPLTYISASDILKIKRTDSSIAFIDACMSGRGHVGITGVVGMSEAFHLIGAKNVICYLEPVEDNIATQFSNRFYLELSKGKSCHDAFFIAKKSIKQNIKVVLWE